MNLVRLALMLQMPKKNDEGDADGFYGDWVGGFFTYCAG